MNLSVKINPLGRLAVAMAIEPFVRAAADFTVLMNRGDWLFVRADYRNLPPSADVLRCMNANLMIGPNIEPGQIKIVEVK